MSLHSSIYHIHKNATNFDHKQLCNNLNPPSFIQRLGGAWHEWLHQIVTRVQRIYYQTLFVSMSCAVCSCSGTLYSLVETKKNSTRATLNKRRDIRSSETTHSEVSLPLKLALKNMHLVSNDVYSFIFY